MEIAVYCRVSTDKEDQAHSFESQQQYFQEYIQRQPGWNLYRIYADEGITGTSTKKRAAFHQMIQDARLHRFDRILTKEVSRFSRNILDTIAYTRELRNLGIEVYFVNDGIRTLDPDSELRLSIMASIAQEESRKTSSRVKWGQTRRMEQGVVFGRSLLGYDAAGGKLTVNPQGAEIVRLIFHKYVLEGKGTTVIARELREAGYRTLTGSSAWRNTGILKILRNEKYCGDLLQKKTFTPDYLTHQKKRNQGQEPFVYLRDHHPPIVDRELWEAAQREIARRDLDGALGVGHGNRYPLSGKLKCGLCGKSFVARSRKGRAGSRYRVWRCATAASEGAPHTDPAGNPVGCGIGYQVRDWEALDLVRRSVAMLDLDRAKILRQVIQAGSAAIRASREKGAALRQRLQEEQARTVEKKQTALDAFLSGTLSREDMELMNRAYDYRIAQLTQELSTVGTQETSSHEDGSGERELAAKAAGILSGETAPPSFYGTLLEGITVLPHRRLEVRLQGLPLRWVYQLGERKG